MSCAKGKCAQFRLLPEEGQDGSSLPKLARSVPYRRMWRGCASHLGFDLGASRKLNEVEISCLRERATNLNVAALSANDAASDTEIFAGVISCAPDFLILVLTGGLDLQLEDLTRQETSCLRRFLTGLDEEALADLDDGRTPEVISGLSSCIPDVLISPLIDGFGITVEDLSREEHSCLRERIASLDWSNDLDEDEQMSGMFACIPDVLISFFADGFGITVEDLSREEHSCLRGWVANLDWSKDLDGEEQAFGLVACIPDVPNFSHDHRIRNYRGGSEPGGTFLSEGKDCKSQLVKRSGRRRTGIRSCPLHPGCSNFSFTDGYGITVEDLNREQRSCLREWIADLDWSNDLDEEEQVFGLVACVPDVLISLVITESGITMEDLSQEEQSCLRETIKNIDWSNDLTDSEINAGILACTQSSGGTQ